MKNKFASTLKKIQFFLAGVFLIIFGGISMMVPFLPGIILTFIGIKYLAKSSSRILWFLRFIYNRYKARHGHRWIWKFCYRIMKKCPIKIL